MSDSPTLTLTTDRAEDGPDGWTYSHADYDAGIVEGWSHDHPSHEDEWPEVVGATSGQRLGEPVGDRLVWAERWQCEDCGAVLVVVTLEHVSVEPPEGLGEPMDADDPGVTFTDTVTGP